MLPDNTTQNFPLFVPDQVLTSDNLNQLFNYLDMEGRMTRTNLIGIGIVCGLKVKQGSDGNGPYIMITKGTGVTSSGYLVTMPETKYHKFKVFDAVQPRYYEPYVNISGDSGAMPPIPPKTQRFPLWELKQTSETTGTSPLADVPDGLGDKVVMIFVELLETNNKNCDPASCDDKGIHVDVTFRPLLVRKSDALTLLNTSGLGLTASSFNNLKDLFLPRWDVPNTSPVTSEDILNAYLKILKPAFIQNVEDALGAAYDMFKPLIIQEYPSNPFTQLAEKFNFLTDPTPTKEQAVHMQYYYDLFSDLMYAYDEFCKTGKEIMSVCCPDESLFPRHLLLGEAIPLADDAPSSYRHYFIYSPLFECRNLIFALRTLFRRLDLMITSFDTPSMAVSGATTADNNIRITPSQLGNVPLSVKALPYYYKVNTSTSSLHKFWSVEKKSRNRAHQTLSYNANVYNTTDEFVTKPLLFDLEPYNFLRVEGVVGKNITGVLGTILKRIDDNRLPVKVIVLKTGAPAVDGSDTKEASCATQDLEINFDIVRREWEAIIGKTIEYLDDHKVAAKKLIDEGHPNQLLNFMNDLHHSKTFIEDEREQLPAFATVYTEFISVFEKIEDVAQKIRLQLMVVVEADSKEDDLNLAEDIVDHMDEVVLSCRKGAFRAIYQEYNRRLEDIYAKMFFSGFTKHHPGLQHKAGVTMGGTFILVYHAKPVKAGLELTPKQKKAIKKGTFSMQGTVRDASGNPVMGAEVAEKNAKKAITGTNGKYSLSLGQLPTIVIVKAPGFENHEQIMVSAGSGKDFVLTAVAETGLASLANGTVIADFYLPYTCCSDCAPIQFVIQEGPKNRPPVARAGDDISIRLPDNVVTLDGTTSSDPDGDIETYAWAYKTGPTPFQFDNASLAKTDVRNLVLGEYVFTLTVTDSEGETSVDEVKITVLPALNILPQANAGPDRTVILPGSARLAGSATDADGQIVSVKWTKKSGPAGATITNDNKESTDVTFTRAGTYEFTLKVTDDQGGENEDEVTVTVTNPVEKNCGSLTAIVELFKGLRETDPNNYSRFTDLLQNYAQMEGYFKVMELVAAESIVKQIDFFVTHTEDTRTIAGLLPQWFEALIGLIRNPDQVAVRLLALKLYRILVTLAAYIACIQEEDIDKAKSSMEQALGVAFTYLNFLTAQDIAALTTAQRNELRTLKAVLQNALNNVTETGEIAKKPLYAEALKKIIDLLTNRGIS